jgi:acetyl-CoA carboxylase biotin carboxyl carrier protein
VTSRPGGQQRSEQSVNFEEIKELVEIISTRNVNEFELERAGIKIRISKNQPAAAAPDPALVGSLTPPAMSGGAAAATPQGMPPVPVPAAESVPAPGEAEEEGLLLVKSPMVGTFYAAPSPESPPYAKEGDAISPGKVLCIVEAMKLMNEIESEVSGTVVKVYPENGQPVEFGETLFSIRPR